MDTLILDQLCDIESALKRPHAERKKIKALTDLVPAAAPVIDSVVARLQHLGLITDETHGFGFGNSWYATEFDHLCTDALRAIEDLDSSQAAHTPTSSEL